MAKGVQLFDKLPGLNIRVFYYLYLTFFVQLNFLITLNLIRHGWGFLLIFVSMAKITMTCRVRKRWCYYPTVWMCRMFPEFSKKYLSKVRLNNFYVDDELNSSISVGDVFRQL